MISALLNVMTSMVNKKYTCRFYLNSYVMYLNIFVIITPLKLNFKLKSSDISNNTLQIIIIIKKFTCAFSQHKISVCFFKG